MNGDDASEGTNAENSINVVTSTDIDATANLDGFTILGGNANVGVIVENNATCTPGCGGGIFNLHSSPTLTNVTISGNTAAS